MLITEARNLPGGLTPEPEGNGRNQGEQEQTEDQSVMFEKHRALCSILRVQNAGERVFLSSTPKAPM
jgi:hypothetical protein